MELMLIIVVLLLLFDGGGGYWGSQPRLLVTDAHLRYSHKA
ncbi:MAG: hypothetical protein WAR76_14915 [Xanthobacteraceae bacterium]|jgi:hypothetical protein